MYSKPWPRIITGAVVAMIAVAAFVTFTRGETPATDTASATLPGVSGKNAPVVVSSTPTPSSPASADAAEREAESTDSKGTTKTPTTSPTHSGPTTSPTTSAPDPDPTTEPPPPSPSPKPPCGLVGSILGSCK
ncbi:cytoskeletal protein RodZ [Aeromicrobium panaciterrae]|uniref:Cytoskeletal protein RodZ n=1 Tax=Aeromicrobium panaciterrae TaxID=363861 RepID=A0ABU1UMG1_9ACTN|nr:hypothetical protein [Aeromicrobium panaciterrae]MDR7086372.1 cytoskeletal protein RodZ [Aeromicrobium panaciterrae]